MLGKLNNVVVIKFEFEFVVEWPNDLKGKGHHCVWNCHKCYFLHIKTILGGQNVSQQCVIAAFGDKIDKNNTLPK